MADLDPDFAALLTPTAASPPPAQAAQGGLDPDFAALAKAPPTPPPAPFSWGQFFKEQGNNATRAGAKAIWALPGMAMDMGVGVRNLASKLSGGSANEYRYPSEDFNAALDKYTNPPTTTTGKLGEFASSVLAGGAMSGPSQLGTLKSAITGSQLPAQVPSNFAPALTQAQQTLGNVRNAGAVFPPSTVKPSIVNKVVESIGGKTGTEQDASLANMPWANTMARKALGMDPKAEITPQALDGIIKTASAAKGKIISASGDAVKLDQPYSEGISKILDPYRQAGEELGDSFGNPALVKAGEAIDKPQITPKVAMGAVEKLRDQAQMAFRAGDKTTGIAYKGLATNLEEGIDRHLSATGNQNVVDEYRAARALQAKAYDVKDALNPVTGNVDANILKRADYLNGDLKTVADAANIAPKAFKQIADSGSVRNTDIMTGGLAAVMEKQPGFLLYPLARAAVRKGMLTNRGQNMMMGPPQGLFSAPQAAPSVSGFPQSLFGQLNLAGK